MTLATRCTACGTIFRVVPDQLRVSNGWVRCGRCGEAFNALESMVDLPPPRVPVPSGLVDELQHDPETPGARADASHAEEPASSPAAAPAVAATERIETSPSGFGPAPGLPQLPGDGSTATLPAGGLGETLPADRPAMIDLPPGVEVVASDGAVGVDADVPHAAAPFDGRPGAEEPRQGSIEIGFEAAQASILAESRAADVRAGAADERPSPTSGGGVLETAPGADLAPGAAPSFVVKADRAARWRRPGVRIALSLVALSAAAGLAAQVGYVFRDRVAAQWPAARPALAQACEWLQCRVGEYRQIDALSVETTALVRVEGSTVHRLAVTLRNRSAVEVAAPALDLTLADAQGRPLARRVLQMSDLDLPLRTLKPGSELPIQVPLAIGDRQVSGYTVEIFYP